MCNSFAEVLIRWERVKTSTNMLTLWNVLVFRGAWWRLATCAAGSPSCASTLARSTCASQSRKTARRRCVDCVYCSPTCWGQSDITLTTSESVSLYLATFLQAFPSSITLNSVRIITKGRKCFGNSLQTLDRVSGDTYAVMKCVQMRLLNMGSKSSTWVDAALVPAGGPGQFIHRRRGHRRARRSLGGHL